MDAAARRWMYVWIAIGVAIVLVVAGFLIAISNELYDIVDNLDEAQGEVRGTQEDVRPLPEYIAEINASLAQVERAVDPLPRQADRIVGNLRSVHTSLQAVEGTLNQTAGLLTTTSSLLVDTSRSLADVESSLSRVAGTLATTVSLARSIHQELVVAERVRSMGTGAIWRHVRFLNGGPFVKNPENFDRSDHNHRAGKNPRGLRRIETDADRIRVGLQHTNKHLESICRDLPPIPFPDGGDGTVPPLTPTPDTGTTEGRPDC